MKLSNKIESHTCRMCGSVNKATISTLKWDCFFKCECLKSDKMIICNIFYVYDYEEYSGDYCDVTRLYLRKSPGKWILYSHFIDQDCDNLQRDEIEIKSVSDIFHPPIIGSKSIIPEPYESPYKFTMQAFKDFVVKYENLIAFA